MVLSFWKPDKYIFFAASHPGGVFAVKDVARISETCYDVIQRRTQPAFDLLNTLNTVEQQCLVTIDKHPVIRPDQKTQD